MINEKRDEPKASSPALQALFAFLFFHFSRVGTLLALLLGGAAPAAATVQCTISLAHRDAHLAAIRLQVPDVEAELLLKIPAWNGLYQIRDFSHHVQNVRAHNLALQSLPVSKLDSQTWRVLGGGGVTVEYAVYWDEPGPFSSQLDSQHAFLNLATVLMYVASRRGEEARLEFADVPQDWRIAVALEPAGGSNTFRAANYDALVDAPVEMGRFLEFRLAVGGARIRVVVHGGAEKQETLAETVRRIVAYQTGLMGEAPFPEYLILYHFGQGGEGGMEHANSTAIFLSADASPASVTAHEFFHLWNVKRIRPQSLEPVDYTGGNWTRVLWFAEGVTSAYADYTLVRSGLWSKREFYDALAREISELESRPARHWKSVEEASLDAWNEKYPLYRGPAFSISYYNKGLILGMLLDILIRDHTANHKSLDDVLRYLNDRFARRGSFYNDSADIRAAVEAVAGRSFDDFFARYVSGIDDLPCEEILARAGLLLKHREEPGANFSFWASRGMGGDTIISQVDPGSPAEQAGLRPGDALIGLEGAGWPQDPEAWLRKQRPGQAVRVRMRRRGEEREVSVVLSPRHQRGYEIEEEKTASEKSRKIRQGILAGRVEP